MSIFRVIETLCHARMTYGTFAHAHATDVKLSAHARKERPSYKVCLLSCAAVFTFGDLIVRERRQSREMGRRWQLLVWVLWSLLARAACNSSGGEFSHRYYRLRNKKKISMVSARGGRTRGGRTLRNRTQCLMSQQFLLRRDKSKTCCNKTKRKLEGLCFYLAVPRQKHTESSPIPGDPQRFREL